MLFEESSRDHYDTEASPVLIMYDRTTGKSFSRIVDALLPRGRHVEGNFDPPSSGKHDASWKCWLQFYDFWCTFCPFRFSVLCIALLRWRFWSLCCLFARNNIWIWCLMLQNAVLSQSNAWKLKKNAVLYIDFNILISRIFKTNLSNAIIILKTVLF